MRLPGPMDSPRPAPSEPPSGFPCARPEPLPASAYSSRGVAHAWLQEIGLAQYARAFEDAGFSGEPSRTLHGGMLRGVLHQHKCRTGAAGDRPCPFFATWRPSPVKRLLLCLGP